MKEDFRSRCVAWYWYEGLRCGNDIQVMAWGDHVLVLRCSIRIGKRGVVGCMPDSWTGMSCTNLPNEDRTAPALE